jgi:hypothetical protein
MSENNELKEKLETVQTEVNEESPNLNEQSETVPPAESEQPEKVENADGEKATLPKKSELLKEQIELEKQYDSESAAMLEDTYNVKFGTKGAFDRMMKYLEKDVEFDHSTATGLALLYSNMRQQKPFTREADWNGEVQLKTSSCLMLWKFLMAHKGHGFWEAKAFLETIQLVGQDISKSINTINEKQTALRGIHDRLNVIYNKLDSNEYENDLTEEEEKALLESSKEVIKNEEELNNEVNPSVD